MTLCLAVPLFSAARAQDFSHLQGKQLTLVNGEDIVTAGLSRLFGGKIDGRIERVTVTDDRERRLAIKVAYTGLADLRLSGEVQTSDKRTQRQVKSNAMSTRVQPFLQPNHPCPPDPAHSGAQPSTCYDIDGAVRSINAYFQPANTILISPRP